jgi:hypothetical protein
MAQAKTRGSKKSSSASAQSRSRSRKPRSRKPQPSSRVRSSKQRSTKPSPSATERLREVPQNVEKTGKKVGRNVGKAASKAKVPLLASGAALAGTAGGLAIGAMRSRHSHKGLVTKALRPKRVKISSQDVAKAARGIGTVSQHVADLTSEMNGDRRAKNSKRKSPVEVVLEGLTARR